MVTLLDSQKKLFDILDDYFLESYEEMKKEKWSSIEAANKMLRKYDSIVIDSIYQTIYEELYYDFWEKNYNSIADNCKQSGGLKVFFNGGVPLQLEEFINKSLLYVDTILISDAFSLLYNSRFEGIPQLRSDVRYSGYRLFQYSLTLLKLKDIILSNNKIPPIAIVPSVISIYSKEYRTKVKQLIEDDEIDFATDIFGTKISSTQEIANLLNTYKTPTELISHIKKVEYFKCPLEKLDEPIDLLNHYFEIMLDNLGHDYNCNIREHPVIKQIVYELFLFGQLELIIPNQLNCDKLGANPIMEEYTDMQYYLWKIKKDNLTIFNNIKKDIDPDVLISNILHIEDFKWLGNIPLKSILKIRDDGGLQDIRDIFKREISHVNNVNENDFLEIIEQVKYNLKQAFIKHEKEVEKIDKQYRKQQFYNTSGVVMGVFSCAAGLFPPLNLLSVAGGLVGTKSIFDIIHDWYEKKEIDKELLSRPVGILFEAQKKAS